MNECKDTICLFFKWMFCKDPKEMKGWEAVWFIVVWFGLLTLITLPFAK